MGKYESIIYLRGFENSTKIQLHYKTMLTDTKR